MTPLSKWQVIEDELNLQPNATDKTIKNWEAYQ